MPSFLDLPPGVMENIVHCLVFEPAFEGQLGATMRIVKLKEIQFPKSEGWDFGKGIFLVSKQFFRVIFPLPAGWGVAWCRSRFRRPHQRLAIRPRWHMRLREAETETRSDTGQTSWEKPWVNICPKSRSRIWNVFSKTGVEVVLSSHCPHLLFKSSP